MRTQSAICAATTTITGTDPDRASFTIALETARQTLTRAAGVITDDASLTGRIGQAVLGGLLPPRHPGSAPAKSNPRYRGGTKPTRTGPAAAPRSPP